MKTSYIDFQSRAMVNISEMGLNLFEVNRVQVPAVSRRKGIGSKLMKELVKDADINQVTLQLYINPYGEMTFEQLAKWYQSFGFKTSDQQLWVRKPQKDAKK